MKHNVISIDGAKNIFQVCVLNQHNKVHFNKKVTRANLLPTLSQLEANTVVMEACYSSNAWGRAIQTLGHQVKLIPTPSLTYGHLVPPISGKQGGYLPGGGQSLFTAAESGPASGVAVNWSFEKRAGPAELPRAIITRCPRTRVHCKHE
jgi:hypothetical protein